MALLAMFSKMQTALEFFVEAQKINITERYGLVGFGRSTFLGGTLGRSLKIWRSTAWARRG